MSVAKPQQGAEPEEHSSWRFDQGDEIAPGRYALHLLGDGTLCESYLAWDDRLFSLVVVKIIRPDLVDDSHTRRRLRREAESLTRLSHPTIPRCFDLVPEGERPHLVEEFVEGPPLYALVRRARLDLDRLIPLFLRISSALHYMAGEGMLHLDVKPSNIIVGAHPRLIDFSLARSLRRAAQVSSPIGTDPYMAPEQCDPGPRGPIGTPADMWGLGATMYHAACGRVPFRRPEGFDADDLTARFPQLERSPGPLPSGLPPALVRAITGCLQSDPADRPAPAEVATALERLIVE